MIKESKIKAAIPYALSSADIDDLGPKQSGKVRDYYIDRNKRILITTDRLSAFDIVLGAVPFKGAVLNNLAAFWFEKTQDIVPNHLISLPHPNVTIAQECDPIPIEMIVRGYLTGVTKTSPWESYQRGERTIYGIKFPNNLKKNDALPHPIITPTTHGGSTGHDERLTREEILRREIVSPEIYFQMEEAAVALFAFGSIYSASKGIILVDTKYEFGLREGKLTLMDEIHTPDSSRFWDASTFDERKSEGLEPENLDKELVRKWYAKLGFRGDGEAPPMDDALKVATASLYIKVYEQLTGELLPELNYPILEGIKDALKGER